MVKARHKPSANDWRKKRKRRPSFFGHIEEDGTFITRNNQFESLEEAKETAKRLNAELIIDDRRSKNEE